MKLLLILSIATLALCQEAFEAQKGEETNDVPQGTTILQVEPDSGVQPGDKKLDKRSHGWGGHGWGGHGWGGWGHGWPIYTSGWSHGIGHGHGHGHGWSGGWGGHGWYGGWYPGWPWWYGSSGWHGGHGGWHGKW